MNRWRKDIADEIFWNYFKYQNPSFLAKDLTRAKQANNDQLVNNISNWVISDWVIQEMLLLKNKFIKL